MITAPPSTFGVFVTVERKGGIVHGCIGRLEGGGLDEAGVLNSVAHGALFEDRRGDEYRDQQRSILADPEARVKLSWLHSKRRMDDEIMTHLPAHNGILVESLEDDGRRATFLPLVFSPSTPLRIIKQELLKKANIVYSARVVYSIYETKVVEASMPEILKEAVVKGFGRELAKVFMSKVLRETDRESAVPPYTMSRGSAPNPSDLVRNASVLATALDRCVMGLAGVDASRLIEEFHPTLRKFITTYLLIAIDPITQAQALSFVVPSLVCPKLQSRIRPLLLQALGDHFSKRRTLSLEFELPEIALAAGDEASSTKAIAQLMSDPNLERSIFQLNWTTQLNRTLRISSDATFSRLVALWLEMGRAEQDDPINVACVKFEGLSALVFDERVRRYSQGRRLLGLWMGSALDMMRKMRSSMPSIRLDLMTHSLHGICFVCNG